MIKMRVNPPLISQGSTRKQLMSNYSVRFSPFEQTKTRLAVASSKHFGMIGGGAIQVFDTAMPADDVAPPHPASMRLLYQIPTPDSQFDLCFNEHNPG